MVIRHLHTNKVDKRYTVELEFCGHVDRQYVARFCGAWIGKAPRAADAWILAQEHYDNHKIDSAYGGDHA